MYSLIGGDMEEKFKDLIKETIRKIVNIEVDENINLCSISYGIPAYLFLYVISDLEMQTNIPVSEVIGKNTYDIFTVSNLAKEMVLHQNNMNNDV